MIAGICTLIPPFLLVYFREKKIKGTNDRKRLRRVIFYIFSVLAVNLLMVFILRYVFHNSGSLIYKLNHFVDFSSKYMILSIVFAFTEPHLESCIRKVCRGEVRKTDLQLYLKNRINGFRSRKKGIRNLWTEWNKNRKILYYVAGMLVVGCVFLFLGTKKDIWFCDEVYSYMSANADGIKQNIFSLENEWISGKDVAAYFSAEDYRLNFGTIANALYTDHVPLYFWVLRLASIINMGSCSKWVGLGINLVFYCVLYSVLWRFFERIGG